MKTFAKVSAGLLVVCLLVAPASATTFGTTYGWEDGTGTILGQYGNLANPLNVTEPPGKVHTDDRALQYSEEPHGGTPQGYVAYITGLTDGDLIDVGLWGWDDDNSGQNQEPKWRIWGHYGVTGDITVYSGSASGPTGYSTGLGWEQMTHQWTFDSDLGSRDALIIEARAYSYPYTDPLASTDYWFDDLSVDVTTNHGGVVITTPGGSIPEPTSLAFLALGGLALLRRR